jgi:RNA polymerase sigma-70 factor (ECF subfamily)
MQEAISSDVVQRARQGDAAAVGAIFRQFHLGIYRYMVYRVNDQQAAEDLTSEVFMRMIKSLPRYRIQGIPFQAWLYRIARNLSIDHSRRNGKYSQVQLGENLVDDRPTPAVALEQHLTSEHLKGALTRLNKDQRDVIVLRFVVCLPIADTALVLHKSENAIKGLQRRGLANLRVFLSGVEVNYV